MENKSRAYTQEVSFQKGDAEGGGGKNAQLTIVVVTGSSSVSTPVYLSRPIDW